jgi:hypothetical protein
LRIKHCDVPAQIIFMMSTIGAENTPMTIEHYPDERMKAIIDDAGCRTEQEDDAEVDNSSSMQIIVFIVTQLPASKN